MSYMATQECQHQNYTKEIAAARSAAAWNVGMGAVQAALGGITGNIGFVNESAHNFADAGAFYADGEALKRSPKVTKRLRRLAATVLTIGGIAGISGGVYQLATGEREDASKTAIGLAATGAVINFGVARKTHNARHHEHAHGHTHEHTFDAHSDNVLHAVTDAGTGFLYTVGLALEHKIPGAASATVLINGLISTMSAAATHHLINVSTSKHPSAH